MPGRNRSEVNRVSFTVLLAAAMAFATFAGPAFAVLARFIIDDLGLSRAELGWVVAAFSVVGAIASPAVGKLTDRVGGRKALAGIFILSGLGMLAISAAPSYAFLIAAGIVTGMGQASGNPATNKLISVHIPIGGRGAVTGLKQSGVQIGVFLAGVLLPAGALAWGWRTTLTIAGSLSVLTLGTVGLVIPPDPPAPQDAASSPGIVWSKPILWLTSYGFLMGLAGGAVNTYIPLFGEESIGLSVRVAGSVAGIAGLVAFFSRLAWARHSERTSSYVASLRWIAGLSVVFVGALLAAQEGGAWLLWIGALGLGASATAWNAVGMLAVMVFAGREQSGGASGVVLLGFLAGLGLGPPLFGWSVDRFGQYGPGLWGALGTFAVAAALARLWERTKPFPHGDPTV
ncbi:MAG: MFS transporter [Acidimicrobiia bacterium]|nr:MFS transporter [Acidimicrobiia bacterium]